MIGQGGDESRVELEGRSEEDGVRLVRFHERHSLVGRQLAVLIGNVEHPPRPLDHRQIGAPDEGEPWLHSTTTFALAATSLHRSMLLRIIAVNSSGVVKAGVMPRPPNRSATS